MKESKTIYLSKPLSSEDYKFIDAVCNKYNLFDDREF